MANYCFTAPILPGGEEKLRRFVQDEINHNPNHDRVFQKAGITREQVWIQRTPMGDFAVASYEIDNPTRAFEELAKSTDPWAEKFRNHLMQAHGFDLTQPMLLNEQVLDWDAVEKTRVTEDKNARK
jgi:hypothetical protein